MSRNYGLGSRDMVHAVKILLQKESLKGSMSFGSAATNTERFCRFEKYLKQKKVNRLEQVTRTHIIEYGKCLALKTNQGELSSAYSQNLVSALQLYAYRLTFKTVFLC